MQALVFGMCSYKINHLEQITRNKCSSLLHGVTQKVIRNTYQSIGCRAVYISKSKITSLAVVSTLNTSLL